MILKNNNNNQCDSDPTAYNDAVGGNYQKWKLEIENVSQKLKIDCFGKNMGEIQNVIQKFNKLDCPITLNPSESTFLDVGIWAYFERRLTVSTIEKRLRYARFMQNHQVAVDFYNPSYENFRKHMNFREQVEKASPNALIHEWKTMRMFLQAYGIPLWPYKPPIEPKHKKRIIPYPDIVRDFFYYDFTGDNYENALYQYLFYHSFMMGWRVPSEICEMKTDDLIIDSKGRGSITITETKKRKSERTILPERFILSSSSHKSMKNWIDIWRPKVENQHSGDALYLQPDGKPFTVRHLGHKLSEHGKKIWQKFQPYDMRHWCAIARLIETKVETGNYDKFRVKNWLGHENQKTTDSYVHYAEMYYNQYPKSWIQNALRSHSKNVRGKQQKKTRVCKNRQTLLKIPSRRGSGPAQI